MTRFSALLFVAAQTVCASTVLYDATSGLKPGASGWTKFAPGSNEFMGTGYVDFSTLALNGLQGGYTRPVSLGDSFRLRLDVNIFGETHASNDRAGFALIALDSAAQGVELSFWQDEVWVQNAGFTHGEGTPFDTSSGIHRYDLFVVGGAYRLEIDGVSLRSGAVRDYSSFGAPYNIPNFLFLGDDTTSAGARIQLAFVELDDVPEPGAAWLTASGLLLLVLAFRAYAATPARPGMPPGPTPR